MLTPPSAAECPFSLADPTDVVEFLEFLSRQDCIDILQSEVDEEVESVLKHRLSPHFYPARMYWVGYSGAQWAEEAFPKICLKSAFNRGFHHRLIQLYLAVQDTSEKKECLEYINTIWQGIWSLNILKLYPSTYSVFCRNPVFKHKDSPLRVRDEVIVIEAKRNEARLDKALLTPTQISRQSVANAVEFAIVDFLQEAQPVTDTLLSTKDRAAFFLTQIVLGSRFKGIAETNHLTDVNYQYSKISVTGVSKSKDPFKKINRHVNIHLLKPAAYTWFQQWNLFFVLFNHCRRTTETIFDMNCAIDAGERRSVLNTLRKQVKTYMNQLFPGILRKGESTHFIRKLYLQIAYEEYGQGMKETGFAAKAFGHEGYNTSLHYTSIQLV